MDYSARAKLNTQVSEEAAEWFIDFRCGDVDAEGRRAFEAWVRSSPEHLRAYIEHAALWTESDLVDSEQKIDLENLIAAAKAEHNVVSLEPVRRARMGALIAKKPLNWTRAAAIVLVLAASSLFAYFQLSAKSAYFTDAGEQRSISLPDGSTVELNTRSRLKVRYTHDERAVELLEGQALFDVVHEPTRPFFVRSGEVAVRAVGTQFDVYRKKSDTVVTVVEGKVAITYGAPNAFAMTSHDSVERQPLTAPVYLSAGEQVAVNARAAASAPVRVNTATETAWTQRQLVLKSALLGEVAEQFNRYSSRKMIVQDTAADELRLSGVFSTNPDFMIRYLRSRGDVVVTETDRQIQILHHDSR